MKWKSTDGQIVPIAELTDSELVAAVNLIREQGRLFLDGTTDDALKHELHDEARKYQNTTVDDICADLVPPYQTMIDEIRKRGLETELSEP